MLDIVARHLAQARDFDQDARTVLGQVVAARDERHIQALDVAAKDAEACVDNLRRVAEPLVAESSCRDLQELLQVLSCVEEAGATSKAKAVECVDLVSKHFCKDALSFG